MSKSEALFARAQKVMPGGVNSPVRAFQGVGGSPLFFEHGEGAFVTDADGKKYIDYVGSWGPLILGHRDPDVLAAIHEEMNHGLSFGAPVRSEILLAEKIVSLVPSIDKVRMVSSGTEATMTAIRIARAFTGRSKVVKFQGCYHGHNDSLLVKAGSGPLTLGIPGCAGVPTAITNLTLNIDYNNSKQIHEVFAQFGDDIACVILEPVAANMGCVPPTNEFLRVLKQACTNFGALLVFDEVITGFRVGLKGAQSLYHIEPDLITFGKIIGGGMPVGAIAGKDNIMSQLAPMGPVYQAGTLSGNPVAMAAGLATLNKCAQSGFYEQITDATKKLAEGFQAIAREHRIPMVVNWVPGLFGFFFTEGESVKTYDDVMTSNVELFKKFFHGMLKEGVYFAPSAFEAAFVSICHDDDLIEMTLNKANKVFAGL